MGAEEKTILSSISSLFQKMLKPMVWIIFASIIISNIYYNLFIFAGYYITYNSSKILYFIIALFTVFLLILVYLKVEFSKKTGLIVLFFMNLISFFLRILLINSFFVGPAGDAWEVFNSASQVLSGNLDSITKGGYIQTYFHQLGGMTFLLPQIKLFGFNFSNYYILNSVLVQLSLIFLTISIMNVTNIKTAIFGNLLLNSFIPNYFYVFILYSEVWSLFFVSIAILLFTQKNIKSIYKGIPMFLILGLAIFIKTYVAVVIIAFSIIVLLFKRVNAKTVLKALLILTLLFIPAFLAKTVYNGIFETELGAYSLPSTTWLIVGLSGSGYTNEYANYFSQNNNDSKLLGDFINSRLKDRIDYLSDFNHFKLFVMDKFLYTWTDQDLDSMNYILPSKYAIPFSEFENDNTIRFGRASSDSKPTNMIGEFIYEKLFVLRNIEKIQMHLYLVLCLITSFLSIKRRSPLYTLLELCVIGFTVLLIFIETQPRYIFLIMNLMIMYAGFSLFEIKEHIG